LKCWRSRTSAKKFLSPEKKSAVVRQVRVKKVDFTFAQTGANEEERAHLTWRLRLRICSFWDRRPDPVPKTKSRHFTKYLRLTFKSMNFNGRPHSGPKACSCRETNAGRPPPPPSSPLTGVPDPTPNQSSTCQLETRTESISIIAQFPRGTDDTRLKLLMSPRIILRFLLASALLKFIEADLHPELEKKSEKKERPDEIVLRLDMQDHRA
jgi:hypothetical protein